MEQPVVVCSSMYHYLAACSTMHSILQQTSITVDIFWINKAPIWLRSEQVSTVTLTSGLTQTFAQILEKEISSPDIYCSNVHFLNKLFEYHTYFVQQW